VALVAGEVVGTAAREGDELLTFFVHPDFQGRRIGTRLLACLEDAAHRDGLRTLRVEASITGAPFYERRGYRRTGGTVLGTAGPHVPLAKEVGEPAG
jgi:putative acetyltransferase